MEITREVSTTGWPRFLTRSRKETFAAWLFIFPDCIGLLVFVAIPMVLALSLRFFSVDGFGGYKFVGKANDNRMLRDPLFMKSLGVTIVYVLCLVPGLYVSGLGLALVVRQRIPLVGLWRTLFFMPHVVSLVVVALIWKVMLVDQVGFINRMLKLIGPQGRSWLGDPNLALGAVLVVTIWFFDGLLMRLKPAKGHRRLLDDRITISTSVPIRGCRPVRRNQ